jgi:hypothetical protein
MTSPNLCLSYLKDPPINLNAIMIAGHQNR